MDITIPASERLGSVYVRSFYYETMDYENTGDGRYDEIPCERGGCYLDLRYLFDDAHPYRRNTIQFDFKSIDGIYDFINKLSVAAAYKENEYHNSRLSLEEAIEDADERHYFLVRNMTIAHEDAIIENKVVDGIRKVTKKKMPKSA